MALPASPEYKLKLTNINTIASVLLKDLISSLRGLPKAESEPYKLLDPKATMGEIADYSTFVLRVGSPRKHYLEILSKKVTLREPELILLDILVYLLKEGGYIKHYGPGGNKGFVFRSSTLDLAEDLNYLLSIMFNITPEGFDQIRNSYEHSLYLSIKLEKYSVAVNDYYNKINHVKKLEEQLESLDKQLRKAKTESSLLKERSWG